MPILDPRDSGILDGAESHLDPVFMKIVFGIGAAIHVCLHGTDHSCLCSLAITARPQQQVATCLHRTVFEPFISSGQQLTT